jgi:choline dehydrogenase-like flavoprotein
VTAASLALRQGHEVDIIEAGREADDGNALGVKEWVSRENQQAGQAASFRSIHHCAASRHGLCGSSSTGAIGVSHRRSRDSGLPFGQGGLLIGKRGDEVGGVAAA